MPIYEYVCTGCANRSEVIHGISADGPTTCELCGGTLRRALSVPAIVFKGSGWAKKDARDASRSSSTAAKPASGGQVEAPAAAGAATNASTSDDKVPAASAAGAGSSSGDGTATVPAGGSSGSSSPSTAVGGSARGGGSTSSGSASSG